MYVLTFRYRSKFTHIIIIISTLLSFLFKFFHKKIYKLLLHNLNMPIKKKGNDWYWGSKGPFKTRKKAEQVAKAAYSSGYKKKH